MEDYPEPRKEVLHLRGMQQIEVALGALVFADVRSRVTQILSAAVTAHEVITEKCKNNTPGSSVDITLGGKNGTVMREQVMMSLEIVLASDASSEEQKIAAWELLAILGQVDD